MNLIILVNMNLIKNIIAGRENDFSSNSCEIQINDVFLGLRICIDFPVCETKTNFFLDVSHETKGK